jgi:hypothetical protein
MLNARVAIADQSAFEDARIWGADVIKSALTAGGK